MPGAKDLTCEDKYDIALEKINKLCKDMDCPNIWQIIELFFNPPTAVDGKQFFNQVKDFLVMRETCIEGNNAEEVCQDCGDTVPTGCDDLHKCVTTIKGWNYVQLARAAERSMGLPDFPVRIRKPQHGDVLVFDSGAIPDNKPCDPCRTFTYGAWVNKNCESE